MATSEVDADLCIGCGSCVEICPEVFQMPGEKTIVIGPDKCGICNCREAADICPT